MKQISTPLAVLILLVWGCLLTLGVGIYAVTAEPQRLIGLVIQHAHLREHGITLSVERLSPLFWPTPGLRLDNVLLRSSRGDTLHTQALSLHLDWTRLLTGRFVPGSIDLEKPGLMVFLPPQETADDPVPAAGTEDDWLLKLHAFLAELETFDLGGVTLRLRQGQVRLFAMPPESATAAGGASVPSPGTPLSPIITLNNLDGVVRLPGLLNGLFEIEASDLLLPAPAPGLPALHLREVWFELDEIRPHVLETANGPRRYLAARLDTGSKLDVPNIVTEGTWQLTASMRQNPRQGELPLLDGQFEALGGLMLMGQTLPAQVTLPLVRHKDALAINNARVVLENNAASFTGKLELPGPQTVRPDMAAMTLHGRAQVEHLSLARWFGFARDLPDGLQLALDRLSGALDVRLTPAGLDVPWLSVSTMGLTFLGKGGVPSWTKPVIQLEAATPEADLNLIFPGLVGKTATPPTYAGPVLVPSDPKAEHKMGFDIRLKADKGRFWKWQFGNLGMAITPQGRGARLALRSGASYGGSLQTVLGFEDEVSISLLTENVNLEQFVSPLAGYAAMGGKATVRANFRSKNGSFFALVAGLNGQFQSQIQNGYIASSPAEASNPAKRFNFTQLDLSFNGQGNPLPKNGKLGADQMYSGDWRVAINAPEAKGEVTLKGPLRFSTANWLPVEAKQLPANAAFTALGADVSGTGRVSFHTTKSALGVEQFAGTLLGGRATGSFKGTDLASAPRFEAQGQYNLPNLRAFLAGRGLDLSSLPPDALRNVTVNGSAIWSDALVRLAPFAGQIDATTFNGIVQRQGIAAVNSGAASTVPRWTVDLRLGKLNLADYLTPPGSSPGRAAPLPVELLKTFALDGLLLVDNLTVAGLPHENVRIPLKAGLGMATLDPITAALAGGKVNAALRTEATPTGALTFIRYDASHVNMLTLSHARKQEAILAGTALWKIDARGTLRTTADIPSALNGQWRWQAENGYFVEGKHEQVREARRSFTVFTATGSLESGVLRNDNLRIAGPVLNARGQGQVNLNNWTLDYRVNASLPGVPDIPIHFYGKLDQPQSNVNALKVIASALENLGKSAFDVLGDIITAPVRIFQ